MLCIDYNTMHYNFIFCFQISFDWSVQSENETTHLLEVRNSKSDGLPASFLILDNDFKVMRTYRCIANNSVGVGSYCEIDVAGKFYFFFFFTSALVLFN